MKIEADNVEEYINKLPEDRKQVIVALRSQIKKNIPKGFKEELSYGMIGYVVPHSLYPPGYHATPELPLPFINLASQKNHIAIYHSGIYSDQKLMDWFLENYLQEMGKKPDMGKSCIRFKNINKIPIELIGKLAAKMSPEEWIDIYESRLKKR